MTWIEISVKTGGETADAVVELFNRYGRGRAVIETEIDCFEYELDTEPFSSSVVVKTYLPQDGTADGLRKKLEEGLWYLSRIHPMPEPVFREMAESDWAEGWKQQYHRQHVGQGIVIVPAWETYRPTPDQVVIRLEPGMAFGTGLHPTTRLCLEAIETHLIAGSSVLDVGTGSGVLAIAADKLGARSVLAVDADPVAVKVARENIDMNGCGGGVEVRHASLPGGNVVPRHFETDGSLVLLDKGQFDFVVVNILAPVIIGMTPALAARLQPEGQLVAAGLIESQQPDVEAALGQQGLQICERAQEKDWVVLVARRG